MTVILAVITTLFAYAYGSEKGYNGWACGIAGLFGGIAAVIIIFFLPNKKQEDERLRQEAARDEEIEKLKNRIHKLEAEHSKVDSVRKPIDCSTDAEITTV